MPFQINQPDIEEPTILFQIQISQPEIPLQTSQPEIPFKINQPEIEAKDRTIPFQTASLCRENLLSTEQ